MGDHIDLKKTQLRLSEVGSTLVEDTYRWNTPSRMWRTLLPFRTFCHAAIRAFASVRTRTSPVCAVISRGALRDPSCEGKLNRSEI